MLSSRDWYNRVFKIFFSLWKRKTKNQRDCNSKMKNKQTKKHFFFALRKERLRYYIIYLLILYACQEGKCVMVYIKRAENTEQEIVLLYHVGPRD